MFKFFPILLLAASLPIIVKAQSDYPGYPYKYTFRLNDIPSTYHYHKKKTAAPDIRLHFRITDYMFPNDTFVMFCSTIRISSIHTTDTTIETDQHYGKADITLTKPDAINIDISGPCKTTLYTKYIVCEPGDDIYITAYMGDQQGLSIYNLYSKRKISDRKLNRIVNKVSKNHNWRRHKIHPYFMLSEI